VQQRKQYKKGDLCKKLRSQLSRRLSIVFSRLAVADETHIRPHQIFDPEICHKVWVQTRYICLLCNKKIPQIILFVGKKQIIIVRIPSASMDCLSINGLVGYCAFWKQIRST